MNTKELLKKVRRIEIKTKGLSKQIFSGQYHSAFKGRGMAFSEVREYLPGDEIRTIDWNVTARFNSPHVKVFEEERELTVVLLIDVSASGNFGTQKNLKKEIITEISAILAFSAIQNNDKIGVIFFSDRVEKYIPPQKGKSHALRIIRDLIELEPQHTGTNIDEALRYVTNVIKKRSITFVLSDFIVDNAFEHALKIANNKHDVVAMRVYDERESEMPNIGLVRFSDEESGQSKWVNTSSKRVRKAYARKASERTAWVKDQLLKSGVDHVSIATNEPYVKPLIQLFKHRG